MFNVAMMHYYEEYSAVYSILVFYSNIACVFFHVSTSSLSQCTIHWDVYSLLYICLKFMKQARAKSLRFPSAKDVSHQVQSGAKNSTRVSTQ